MIDNLKKNRIFSVKYSWLYSVLFTTAVILIFMISAGCTPFGSYSLLNYDAFHQFIGFCSELRRKALSGESLFYSWNIGLGINFAAVITVILNSPFNILLLFFSNEDICIPVTLIIALKIVTSSGTMGYFLSKHLERLSVEEGPKGTGSTLLIVAISTAYATSGYVCGYYWNFMWLDVIMILPIIILGMDRLINDGKPVLYIFALFYGINCSYYLSIMVCMFLIMYFFTYKYKSFGVFVKKGIKFAACSVLAAGMAALIIIIAYKNIIYSNTSQDSLPQFQWYENIFYILKSHYYLSIPIISQPYDGDANLYCGVISIVAIFIYPFVRRISLREKISKIIILIFLLISMDNTVLNYFWHGLHDQKGVPNRFAFLYVFLLLVIAFDVLILIGKEDIKKFIIPGFVAVMLPIVIYFFNDFNGFVSSKNMFLIALGMSFVYIVLIFVRMYNEKSYKITTFVLSVLIGLEAASAAVISLKYNDLNNTGYFMPYINGRNSAIDYVKSIDNDGFYREEIVDNIIDNESILHGLKSLSLFSSIVSSDMEMTMRNLGVKNADISYYFTDATPFLDDLFGIRYIYSFVDNENLNLEYDEIYDTGNLVYRNQDALPLGFGVSDALKSVDISTTGNGAYNQNEFAKNSVGVDGMFEVADSPMEVYSPELQLEWDEAFSTIRILGPAVSNPPDMLSIYVTYDIDEPGDYYFNCDYHYLYVVDIVVDNTLISENENANQLLHVGELTEGSVVTVLIQMPSFLIGDVPVYLSRYDKYAEKEVVSALAENPLVIDNYSGNTLDGTVTLKDGQMLFLSIPYDTGWRAYIDGRRVDIDKVYGTFMCLKMESGVQHDISLRFIPDGFMQGLILSIVSWIIFIAIIIYEIMRPRRGQKRCEAPTL